MILESGKLYLAVILDDRRKRHNNGKDDTLDAETDARSVVAGRRLTARPSWSACHGRPRNGRQTLPVGAKNASTCRWRTEGPRRSE